MAMTKQSAAADKRPATPLRNLFAASAGNAVEWFDWTIFGLFSTIFATQYFPDEEPILAYLYTASTFALAFLFRPLGGIVIGRLADRRGRKPALLLSICLMCGGSLVIGLTPTFETIGWAAPLLLLLARIAQGISTGGEVGNSYAYLYEIAPADRKGRYASVAYISTGSATLAASLLGYWITSSFDADAISAWGWRIPFIMGAVFGLVVLWLRTSMDESTEYVDSVADTKPVARPLWTTVRDHPRSVLQIIGMVSMTTVVYYTLTNALKVYATIDQNEGGAVGASESDTFLALSIGMFVFVLLQYPFGALADRVGRRNLLLVCAIVFTVITVPLSTLLTTDRLNLVVVFGVGLGLFAMATSIAPAVLSDLLPTNLRGVGIGAWCNLAVALFGGTAPLVITALTAAGHPEYFFWYITAVCALGVFALLTMSDERRQPVPARTERQRGTFSE